MPSVNWGIGRARAAEVRRGLKLEHRGDYTTAEVALNGGTIVLTVASYPDIFNVKTVVAKLKAAQSGSMTVKINSSQTITITAGNLFGSYDNATAFNADDIQISDYSKFEFVKIFRFQLSTEEKAAYQAGTMWNYDRNCVLWMDGKDGYDPTNTRHLDASGAGNHMPLVGSPVKLAGVGYTMDGVNDKITLPSIVGKFPYILIAGQELSTSTAVYDAINTAGAYTGKVCKIALYSTELNTTQIADLILRMQGGVI